MVSAKQLKSRFEYVDGELIFKDGPRKGKIAGCVVEGGYKVINPTIEGKKVRLLLHRAVFLMHWGYLPELVDHIDRDPSNNRVENLRSSNKKENSLNTGLRATNKSGYKGVHKISNGSYEASLFLDGKKIYIGLFKCALSASVARENYAGSLGYVT